MATATIAPDLIPVRPTFREGFGHYLTMDVPNGWEDVKKICKKVLQHNNRYYTFTGWNSDQNECFFRESHDFATIAKKK